jgi:acyl-[acyl-carrier-protein]-phospholipid O-acyltransferase / long-chain-fatty-acid--[acyl-carrier-protein] ligase
MAHSQLRLLATRKLLPLFTAQFLGAVNDNLFKNALVILVAYRDTTSATATEIVVTLAAALFILPYFIFSATAGQLADKFEKSRLVQVVKLWEVGVMLAAAASFALDSLVIQLGVLFLLGVQAAFFGPVKYGILPELLAPDELLAGNGLIEAGTFLAILIGTIAGGLLILAPAGPAIVSIVQLVFAVCGWAASRFIPRLRAGAPELKINPNILGETWRIIRHAYGMRALRQPLFGISWFWLVGAAFLAQFPNYAKIVLAGDNEVVTLFLTLFTIGIGVGSLLCSRLQRGQVNLELVPWGALGLALFGFDLWLASSGPETGPLVGAIAFMAVPAHWRISFDLVAVALAGGIYCVPLYAVMQARSEPDYRARVIAANNILNALFMVFAGIASAVMLALGTGITGIFLALAIGNAAVTAYAFLAR